MKLERAVRSVLYPITKPQHRRRLIAARDTGVSMIATGRSKLRSQRPLPDFIVAGVQKGGTTFLYQEMLRHPEIRGSLTKEVHFFDGNFDKGVDWYSGMFPRSSPNGPVIRGEASPAYIFHPAAVRRIAETLPDPRLIIVVRDPVQRALSHYKHERRLGFEPSATFEEALALEESRVADEFDRLSDGSLGSSFAVGHYSYTRRGLYADQLERWVAVFPREQLLVVRSEDLGERPAETYAEILAFLGAAPHALQEYPRIFGREYADMPPETRLALAARFAEPNRRLEALLGRDLGWA